MQLRAEFSDLVEEQRSTRGLFEDAGVSLGRAGEGALLMAEERRRGGRAQDRCAVEGHEWSGASLRAGMQGLGYKLLTGAALTVDEDRDIESSEPLNELEDVVHLGALADHAASHIVGGRTRFADRSWEVQPTCAVTHLFPGDLVGRRAVSVENDLPGACRDPVSSMQLSAAAIEGHPVTGGAIF